MKAICQYVVKKDSLYPLIKHHVPLCINPISIRGRQMTPVVSPKISCGYSSGPNKRVHTSIYSKVFFPANMVLLRTTCLFISEENSGQHEFTYFFSTKYMVLALISSEKLLLFSISSSNPWS